MKTATRTLLGLAFTATSTFAVVLPTTAAHAASCFTESQTAFDQNGDSRGYAHYTVCVYPTKQTVSGRLVDDPHDGYCSKIEVNFVTGGYRYKATCTSSQSFNWTETTKRQTQPYIHVYAYPS